MTLELKSYDTELAELILIKKCIDENPNMKAEALAKLLGISRSNFYIKIKTFRRQRFIDKLIDNGYTTSEVLKLLTLINTYG